MPIVKTKLTVAVPPLEDGSPDFDPYAFRRQLSELWQMSEDDISLDISITALARNRRALSAIQASATSVFNVTVVRVNPLFESCEVVSADESNTTIIMIGGVHTVHLHS